MLAAEFTSQVGLGSVVNLIAILAFVAAILRYLHRLLAQIDKIPTIVTTLEKINDKLSAVEADSRQRLDTHERHYHGHHRREDDYTKD